MEEDEGARAKRSRKGPEKFEPPQGPAGSFRLEEACEPRLLVGREAEERGLRAEELVGVVRADGGDGWAPLLVQGACI